MRVGDELEPSLLFLKMEEGGHPPRNSEQPLEAGKDKEADSPLAPPGGNAAQ